MIVLFPVERAVLDFIQNIYRLNAFAIADQLRCAKLISRKNTGRGIQTDIAVDCAASKIERQNLVGPDVNIRGVSHPLTFVLFINNGLIDFLEGSTIADTDEIDFERADFHLMNVGN